MRIAIDYTPALRQSAGIGRYTRNLVAALADLDRENQYTLFCAGEKATGAWPANFTMRASRIPARWLTAAWHRLRLPLPAEQLAGDCDLYHSPDFALPPLRRARGVVTVHDLSFLRLPECADPGLRSFLERTVPRSVAQAHRVLADSESTRRDLIELLHVPPEKITVLLPGIEARFRPVRDPARLAEVRDRYKLPGWFILSMSTLEPRKNFARLITAYAQMRRQTGLPHQLVIAGRPGWLYQPIYDQVRKEGLAEQVSFLGFVADEDLPALYTLADLFAFPSLYEGFGLTPLEAMACGTPVVAGNNSSLPEVVGNAGLLVDATDVDAIADAMARVLGNATLCVRLSDLGRAQAARFTRSATAEKLLEAYRLAMT
ncbi:MAG: glycosyltransferase family 1 protein [Chloroflexi bacterium]|nr:glycosyltransferase family 1 protein [Chloroflexota bacterium]